MLFLPGDTKPIVVRHINGWEEDCMCRDFQTYKEQLTKALRSLYKPHKNQPEQEL